MVKPFDVTFFPGTLLVVATLVIADAALTRDWLPVIGAGRGALLAVAVVGMAACAEDLRRLAVSPSDSPSTPAIAVCRPEPAAAVHRH